MAEQPQFDRAELMKVMRGLGSGELDVASVPKPMLDFVKKMTNRSAEEIVEHAAQRREREARAPKPGMQAADFELELLSEKGERTGEMRRLSDAYDKPVGLIFGSYT